MVTKSPSDTPPAWPIGRRVVPLRDMPEARKPGATFTIEVALGEWTFVFAGVPAIIVGENVHLAVGHEHCWAVRRGTLGKIIPEKA